MKRKQATQLALVFAHQLVEGVLVSTLRPFDQRLVDFALAHMF
jgi:hypothetical protein